MQALGALKYSIYYTDGETQRIQTNTSPSHNPGRVHDQHIVTGRIHLDPSCHKYMDMQQNHMSYLLVLLLWLCCQKPTKNPGPQLALPCCSSPPSSPYIARSGSRDPDARGTQLCLLMQKHYCVQAPHFVEAAFSSAATDCQL